MRRGRSRVLTRFPNRAGGVLRNVWRVSISAVLVAVLLMALLGVQPHPSPALTVPILSTATVSAATVSVPTVSAATVSVPTVSVPTVSVPTGVDANCADGFGSQARADPE
jgi:hypothetical protein